MKVNFDKKWVEYGTEKLRFSDVCNRICPYKDDIIYLSGSLIEGAVAPFSEGMGNRFSDLDVFIIREHDQFLQTKAVYSENIRKTFFIDDLPIGLDVEVYDRNYINQLIDVIGKVTLQSDGRVANLYKQELQDNYNLTFINSFLNRLLNSVCIFNADEYEIIKQRVPPKKFLEVMKTYIISDLDNILQDVVGNLENKQYDVALLCMREAMYEAMQLALVASDVFVDRVKWVPLKFLNYCAHDLRFEELKNAYVMLCKSDLRSNDYCGEMVSNAIMVVQRTIEQINLGEWLL